MLTISSRILATTALVLVVAHPADAQADRAHQWLAALTVLNSATPSGSLEEREAQVGAIRNQVIEWIALNPTSTVALPRLLDQPWSEAQFRDQIAVLTDTIERLLKEDPSQPFYLGITSVNVTAPGAALSPVSDHLDQVESRITMRSP
jgi:hypothetical protein